MNLRKQGKILPLHQEKTCNKYSVKETNPNYYQIVNQEYISWIAHAMGNIWRVKKEGFNTMHRTSTEQHEWKVGNGQFDWLHPKTVRISPFMYERKIHEAFEINKLKTINEKDKTFTVLNRNNGDYVTTNFWKPVFMKMGNH